MRTVLVSGAGVAGPTLAFWLARCGFRPTVVERSPGVRSSGSPVDVRGPALPVVERMGVLPALRDVATHVPGCTFVTPSGRRIGPVRLGRPRGDELEVARCDLASVLYDAARDDAEFLFDETVVDLRADPGGVDVVLERRGPRRFDLVVGADGLHSAVRSLAFDPADVTVRPLGLRVATVPLGRPADDPTSVVVSGTPGRSVSVHPGRDAATAAFLFGGPALSHDEHRDLERRRRSVLGAFADHDWEPADLLERVRYAPDLWLDAVGEVRLRTWSTGRTALVGDAAASMSLFGDGSSLALAGAYTLAAALAATPGDHTRAFGDYEARHRPLTDRGRRGYRAARAVLVPGTRAGVTTRDLAVRVLARVTAPTSRRDGDRRSATRGTPT